MKKKWILLTIPALFLMLVSGLSIACESTPSIVGYWQDTEDSNNYIEFSADGKVIFDDGNDITTGTYELLTGNYLKFKIDGFIVFSQTLFMNDTSCKYEISGNTLTLQVKGETITLKRIR